MWLGLAWPLPKVWRNVTTEAPPAILLSFSRVVVALVYCCITFPGVGQAALRGEEALLTTQLNLSWSVAATAA